MHVSALIFNYLQMALALQYWHNVRHSRCEGKHDTYRTGSDPLRLWRQKAAYFQMRTLTLHSFQQ